MLSKKIFTVAAPVVPQSWLQYGFLFLITLFAAGLRFFKLGDWSFWIDEIYTVNHAVAHFSSLELIVEHLPPNRNWVPVSVILTAQIFNFQGISEFNARLVALFFGVISIPIFYWFVRKIFGTRVALISTILLAVSPWHLEWSQNARGYTAILLFYSLALFAFYYAFEKDKPLLFIPFFLFLYLASSERLIALFILPVLLAYILAIKFLPIEKPVGFRPKNFFILLSPALLLGLYGVYDFFVNDNSIVSSIIIEIVDTFVGKPIENPVTQAIFTIYKIGIPLFALSSFYAILALFQKDRHRLLFVLGAIIPFGIVMILTPIMFTEERYSFVTLLSWIVLAALAIDYLMVKLKNVETILAIGILVALLSDAMGANLQYFRINHGNRRDWRQAFSLVQRNMHEGDIVVSTWPELGKYYLKQDVLLWQSVTVKDTIAGEKRVWFVVIPDMAWYTGTEDLLWWVERNARMMKNLYLRTIDNTTIEIYMYDPALESITEPWDY